MKSHIGLSSAQLRIRHTFYKTFAASLKNILFFFPSIGKVDHPLIPYPFDNSQSYVVIRYGLASKVSKSIVRYLIFITM